jgi:hypothetical protein
MNMKFKIHIYLLVTLLVCSTSACNPDFFNQVPNDRMTVDEVFQRRLESEQYLAKVYSFIRDESDQTLDVGTPYMGLSDEGDITYTNHPTYLMNIGNWDASKDFYNFWRQYYLGIRTATYFMQRIGENSEILAASGGEAIIKRYRAEARALRAEFYACILKQYGPAVLLPSDEVVAPDTPLTDLNYARSSYDECVEFIVSEFDKAAEELPLWYDNPNDYGKMTKAVCMGLKARVLLYAASPLWNGNTRYANFKNKDGKQLVNQTYSAEKWKRAADAAKAVIDLGLFSLYKVNDASGKHDPLRSYQFALLDVWNTETIFARKSNNLGSNWEWRATPRFAGGTSGNGVPQQHVDTYQMANGEIPITGYNADGTPIINAKSGYQETGFSTANNLYTETGTYNMYMNREPRFYASITYSGSYNLNKTAFPAKIGMYFTGNNGRNGGNNNFTRTGYLARKNIHPSSNQQTSQRISRPLVLMRLAEIYLGYAEALNEHTPGHADISKYTNLIRERAGIPELAAGLTKEMMRERILLERRIELAFERHRYFDSRRWLIAEKTDGGPFYGLDIDKGTSFTDVAFFKRVVFETRVFTDKNYLFPIPQSEIDKDVNLIQNPGW